MKIVLDIPEKDIPKRQEIMTIDLHFIDGTVCGSSYPCEVLPKGHGDLIDRNSILCDDCSCEHCGHTDECFKLLAPTIIEADGGNMK